jgi:hypothetical protein
MGYSIYLNSLRIAGGTPVVLLVRAADVMAFPIDIIIGKKLLRKVKIINGKATARITTTTTNVLLSTFIFLNELISVRYDI